MEPRPARQAARMIEIPPHVVRLTARECLDFADRVEWRRLKDLDALRAARLRLLAIGRPRLRQGVIPRDTGRERKFGRPGMSSRMG